MLKPITIFNAVLAIGLGSLALAVMLSLVQPLVAPVGLSSVITTLSDAFKLCLGAILALANEHALRPRYRGAADSLRQSGRTKPKISTKTRRANSR
jgi:hypothetical protein